MEKVTRPWGYYQTISLNEKSTVKLLHIDEGHRTSLQTHKKRDETWYVLEGKPVIVKGDKYYYLRRGDMIKIKRGEQHRIQGQCIILEVSTGHFDEGDIERIDDDYKRI